LPDIGPLELAIVALIVVLLFGPGKAADLGGALGKSIREFRRASRQDDAPAAADSSGHAGSAPALPAGAPPARPRFCTQCGAAAGDAAAFCTNCGTPLTAVT